MIGSICIEDFCGHSPGIGPVSFSADWFPAEGLVYFSGDWGAVPPMPALSAPDQPAVWAWARAHGSRW